MTHTLRTTAKRWAINLCISVPIFLSLITLCAYMYFYFDKQEGRFWGLIGLVTFSIALVTDLAPLLRNKIVIDDQTISGRINKEQFSLRWKEVIAVWDSTTHNQPCLNIGGREGGITIPLKFFDETLLRDLIRLHVTPEAFEEDAIKRLPGYHIRDAANERVIKQASDENLRVGAKFVKGVGWVCGLLFLSAAVWSWLDGAGEVSLLFLIFVALGAYLILASGSIEMNKDHITYFTPTGVYQIGWGEVTEVEMDASGGSLVFVGENKRMSALGPAYWSGKDKELMLRLFSAQVETRGLKVKQTHKAMWRLSKNTKIRPKSQGTSPPPAS